MFGGMNPTKIAGMMKKMGISQQQLNVHRVIFEMSEGNIVIDEPTVIKINMQGQTSYQVTGEAKEESNETFSDDDVKMVIEKTGKNENEVRAALEKSNGDIAEAIIELKE